METLDVAPFAARHRARLCSSFVTEAQPTTSACTTPAAAQKRAVLVRVRCGYERGWWGMTAREGNCGDLQQQRNNCNSLFVPPARCWNGA